MGKTRKMTTLKNTQLESRIAPDMKLADFVRLLLEEGAENDPVTKLKLDIIRKGVSPYLHGRKTGSTYVKKQMGIIRESIQD